MKALKDGMKLSKIYQRGVLRWEKPIVHLGVTRPSDSFNYTSLEVYPMDSRITAKIIRGGKVIEERVESNRRINHQMYFKNKFESDDILEVTVTAKGFKDASSRAFVL